MPRNVEDIIPSKKRSIRDVPIPEERRTRSRQVSDEDAEVTVPIRKDASSREDAETSSESTHESAGTPLRMKAPLYRESRARYNGSTKKGVWIAAASAILIVAFAVFSLMKSATLAYTPKSAPLTFQNETFTAYKSGGDGVLLFSVVKISDTKGTSVAATGESQVSRKASGTVVVYNNASAAPQKLIKNTRFQTSDGKVYRVQNDISVPGKTSSGPGSLEVTVYADQAGDTYNIGLSDFTLPGLKGDPRYSTIYARSKTPMSGGYIGTEKSVDPDTLAATKSQLETALKDQLVEEAQAQVPADFILFPSLATVTYEDAPQSTSTVASNVTVNERGDFIGVIFKRSDLAEYMKNKKLSIPSTQTISIDGLSDLTFSFTQKAEDLLQATQVSFQVSGEATAVWDTDESTLKNDLAGHAKSDLAAILKNYPSIASADAVIRPFWKTTFPTDPTEITITKKAWK